MVVGRLEDEDAVEVAVGKTDAALESKEENESEVAEKEDEEDMDEEPDDEDIDPLVLLDCC